MESKFIKIDNKKEWQDLLNRVLFKTFFHNIEWEEFLEQNFKWLKFERYLYNNVALLSLARVGDKLISHPFCEYGGPLPLVEKIDADKFKQDLFSEFKNPIKISFHPYLFDYFQNGWGSNPDSSGRMSYFVEGPPDLRKTTRHEIEKAQNQNIQIKKCQNKEDLKIFYSLHVKGAKKHKIPAYPPSFFNYFWRSPEAEIILARFENKVIAGSVFLFYDKFIHYFQNAVDEKYKKLGANYLILWEQIQNKNDRIFDFGGTRINSSLQVFKKGWGGKEYSIYELSNYKKTNLRDSKLRNIFGLLPLFLIRKLSPYLLKYKL
jgi:hypothetical protein